MVYTDDFNLYRANVALNVSTCLLGNLEFSTQSIFQNKSLDSQRHWTPSVIVKDQSSQHMRQITNL